MPKKTKPPASRSVDATVHKKAKRVNIPTSELGSFVKEEERRPEKLLYPRDPSLDPQMVWKGKDEQDSRALEVPAVPIYIQEKIAPKAIIENLRAEQDKVEPQASLFSDFNGIDFETLVDFYHHQQNWSNRMILGDSLLVMTSLAEKERLKGLVQCIYMDPPYGIKFGSNWQVSTRKRDVKDGKAEDATRQPEQIRAFRDTWELGIHSYLSYMRDRLQLARELLTESGSVFVQIGEQNVHLVRCLLDEVFGAENYCAQIAFRKTTGKGSALLDNTYDNLLWYAKDRKAVKHRPTYFRRQPSDDANFRMVEVSDGSRRSLTAEELMVVDDLPAELRVYRPNPLTSQSASSTTLFSFEVDAKAYVPGKGGWKTNEEGMVKLAQARRLQGSGNTLQYVRFFGDFPYQTHNDIWDDTRQSGFGEPKVFVVQTATRVIERCLLMTTDPGDLVLDPTCGSGTTAYVAEQWGRRWVTIDTSRVALALARTRLMAARFPYYVLADSADGLRIAAERVGRPPLSPTPQVEGDVRKGFVYKQAPHITLKSIANNPEIRAGMTREEIDTAIARHAETETLYDQPEIDSRVVRVTGPFTVESLSPHRVMPGDTSQTTTFDGKSSEDEEGDFVRIVLEHLRKAGVQNTVRSERLVFESLEPWAGTYVQAVGEYNKNGRTKRAAVAIGPQYGTVDAEFVREAAKEAVRFFDILVVCGFAFDARVQEETKQLGSLTVLKAAMNPDIAMGDDFLKKTGSGNLFMVFGEPDLEVRKGDEWVVEVKGIDVYDPTTGEIRSHSTDDIACWFIDSSYNEESFFVRHAYFLGGGDPYEQLKRALRSDIDEIVWSSLYSTVSRPFPRPKTGKIAVKVINHYGDEVMKVYEDREN